MFVVGTFNNEYMEAMAAVTDKVKRDYCDRHGYEFFSKKDNWRSSSMGFARIHFVKEVFETYPRTEWLFLVDCDAIVTNFNIKIEDRVDNNYHAMYTLYFNGFNVGVGLFRNSVLGRSYIDHLLTLEDHYKNHPWSEQQAIIDTYEQFKSIIKVVPARYMNGVQKHLYRSDQLPTDIDPFGESMLWQRGDWVVHWPGANHQKRIEQSKLMVEQIER